MESLKQIYKINATAETIWKTLTINKYINAWGGGPATMKDEVNFKFKLCK